MEDELKKDTLEFLVTLTVQELKDMIKKYNLTTHIALTKNKKALKKHELIQELMKHVRIDENRTRIIPKNVKSVRGLQKMGIKIPKGLLARDAKLKEDFFREIM